MSCGEKQARERQSYTQRRGATRRVQQARQRVTIFSSRHASKRIRERWWQIGRRLCWRRVYACHAAIRVAVRGSGKVGGGERIERGGEEIHAIDAYVRAHRGEVRV